MRRWGAQDVKYSLAKPLARELFGSIIGPKVLDDVLGFAVDISRSSPKHVDILKRDWKSSFIRDVEFSPRIPMVQNEAVVT